MKKITTIYLISIFLLAQNITAQTDRKSIKTVVVNKLTPQYFKQKISFFILFSIKLPEKRLFLFDFHVPKHH